MITPRRVLPLLTMLFSSLWMMTAVSAQPMRVYYPDIEQGSATLVVSPTGKAMLVDAGSGIQSADDRIEDFINDLIDAGVVTSLDVLLASHYDEDHIGRMENVLQLVPLDKTAITYDRGEFMQVPSTFAYSDYSFSAGFHNRTTVPICTVIDLGGGVTATVMTVNGEVCGNSDVDVTGSEQLENAVSVSVLVEYQDFDLWIGGDLTGNPDFNLADVETPAGLSTADVDVYTVNHHGSRSSSNASFLSDLKPEVAINQNSAGNNFGHPNTIVVNRILATPDSNGQTPQFFQQNPGLYGDDRSDDNLASGIADCDDPGSPLFGDGFETGDTTEWEGPSPSAVIACNQPGTLTLFSNGTSYRLHACGISPRLFAADEGLGTLGAFPPAIRKVSRIPEVPTAAQAVEVTAKIHGASTVELQVEVNGVAEAPVAMSALGGNTYSGTIPPQLDGARVAFRVAATDSVAQTELSPSQGYFSGTTPIATLRLNNDDSVLVPKHYGARVTGNVTAEPGLFHPTVTLSYVQDATGGLQIFDAELLALARGDQATFVGRLEQFSGQTELNISEDCGNLGFTLIGAGSAPAPQLLTVSQIGEANEGELVRINGASILDDGAFPSSGSDSLSITDDGGTSTVDLRIDGDTDIPGSNTPTQSFDLTGIVSQFDSFSPLTSGYQIVPREKLDFLTEEVNHPQVLISEIHADPASDMTGDANGDGAGSATQDEFIELVNTGSTAIDIGGYTLSDSVQTRHTFAPGTMLPARESTVVFGGGTPTGAFGNAAANGLVFVASTGSLSLDDAGDSVTFSDDSAVEVQAVTYGAEGGQDQSLVRDPDFSNAPFVTHTTADGSSGSLYSPGTLIDGQAFTVPPGAIILTEVLYDPSGSDAGAEWFELYNTTAGPVDLSTLCVGNGGSDYTYSMVGFEGQVLGAGQTFVVGGPESSGDNGNPTYDLVFEFTPGFQNSGSAADGVALFNSACPAVTATTVPIDAVIYGPVNSNGLIDETGTVNAPDTADASSGQSIERLDLAGLWQIQPTPTPNVFTP